MVVLTYFFIPELKGRTLEEVDQLFASGVPLRKFGQVQTRTAEELYSDELRQQGEETESGGGGVVAEKGFAVDGTDVLKDSDELRRSR